MRVALIYVPYKPHTVFSENIPVVDENFCLGPPIILAYVAAVIERAGHTVTLIDAHALSLSREETLARLREFKPEVLGFRFETYHFHETLAWAAYFKKMLRVPVIGGGINITLYPFESMSHGAIDYGIAGEAIVPLPQLLDALEKGKDVSHIPGLLYRVKAQPVLNPPSETCIDFNEYPFPARHLLPNEKYSSFVSQRKNYTILLSSVGCPFKCTFCVISKIPYRKRDPLNVVDEIEKCYRDNGVREIDFFDGALFVDKERIIRMAREIRRRKIDIYWSCRSRVDLVNEELLDEVSRSGCKRIFYGIESADDSMLKNIRKEITLDQIEQTIEMTRSFGIQPLGFFMIGNPGETKKTVEKSIAFAKKLRLSYVQVCRTIAKPRTGLDDELVREGGTDYWSEYIRDASKARRLPTPWTGLTPAEQERYTKKFYRSFYMRPAVVFERLRNLKSFSELVRYVKVAVKVLMS